MTIQNSTEPNPEVPPAQGSRVARRNKPDVFFPVYGGDYHKKTAHLSTAQHGAYFLLLLHGWHNDGRLPVNDDHLRHITKMEKSEWRRSRATLLDFFLERDGSLRNKRLDEELEKATANMEQKRDAGKASAAAREQARLEAQAAENIDNSFNGCSSSVATDEERRVNPSPSPSPSPSPEKERTDASHPTPPGVVAPDVRTELFNEGLTTMIRLTGKLEAPLRGYIGKCLKTLHDDASVLLAIIREAEQTRPAAPLDWISGAVKARVVPKPGFEEKFMAALGLPDTGGPIIDHNPEQLRLQ